MKQRHRIRPMLHCYFCGGRVVSLTPLEKYRCEAEGVTWDMTESLVIYTPRREEVLTQVRTPRDPDSGKFISTGGDRRVEA